MCSKVRSAWWELGKVWRAWDGRLRKASRAKQQRQTQFLALLQALGMHQDTLFSLPITLPLPMSLFHGALGTNIHQGLWGLPRAWLTRLTHPAMQVGPVYPQLLWHWVSACLWGGERPMALTSWLADLELVAQAADAQMIRIEIFSSEDLTWLWNSGIKIARHLIPFSLSRQ